MSDDNNNGLDLDDPDRLPWLETADGYEYDDGASPMKVAMLVLGGLVLLAAIVGGIYWMQRNQTEANGDGKGELIAAQEGDYKVRPDEAGGKKFEGEGDAAFAAADGKKNSSTVGKGDGASKAAAAAGSGGVGNGKIADGATFVQLGAFGDVANANATWAGLAKRFGFLNGVKYRVAQGKADGGRSVYRLQAATSSAAEAQKLCSKLKAAGENCLIVK